MILKSKYLVLLFATLFFLLLGIQVYFMYKTYQVKEREIYRTVHQGLTNYTDKLEEVTRVNKNDMDDLLQKLFISYHNKEISKKDFLDYFEKNRKNTQTPLSNYVDSRFKKEGYKIAAKIEYYSIVFIPDSTRLIDKPIVLYETKNKVETPGISSSGKWITSSSVTSLENSTIKKDNSFLIKSKTDFEILNIKSIIFKELILLFTCCIILLISVLILYIITVKNLMKHQKQIEFLHSIVDTISHEFKTPIATLKVASKALKKGFNTDTLLLIDRQIIRLEKLMHQLHEDETEGNINEIDSEDWDFFIQDLAFTYPETQFNLENKIAQQLPFDKNLIETIIKNLCENSVKYGASTIKIIVENTQHHLSIEISDNGQGIDKKEWKNIFEKFYRIQSNNIHNTKGLGLGLYFVKKIIQSYKGIIEVDSIIKKGTTFKIHLPYES
ncbi:Sensor histidine kinase WalK [Chryseobacterium potabilaquae]|uniref:histidine kinase n=2 Tax=Chryseobacterium potabilaquae TaxID=2675057 RepID=A0A6N4X9G7_9FLAO|nr:Sensor histidine kinase WalK [Chryseobacterium potabilaquae]